jgi:hypothetical protein
MIIEKGIQVQRVDQDGFVGPHYLVDAASDDEAIELLEMLVQAGWDIDQPSGKRQSTLLGDYIASIDRPKKVIEWLIRHKANLGAPSFNGSGRIIDVIEQDPKLKRVLKDVERDFVEFHRLND